MEFQVKVNGFSMDVECFFPYSVVWAGSAIIDM